MIGIWALLYDNNAGTFPFRLMLVALAMFPQIVTNCTYSKIQRVIA